MLSTRKKLDHLSFIDHPAVEAEVYAVMLAVLKPPLNHVKEKLVELCIYSVGRRGSKVTEVYKGTKDSNCYFFIFLRGALTFHPTLK